MIGIKFSKRQFKKYFRLKTKYHILGVEKCGTAALENYLRNKGFKVIRNEELYEKPNVVELHYTYFPDYQPVMILRDPVERVYSHYWYKRYNQKGHSDEIKCSLEKALDLHPEIIEASKFEKHLKRWKGLPLLIFHLEELQKLDDFHKINTTDKPPLTSIQREMILHRLPAYQQNSDSNLRI